MAVSERRKLFKAIFGEQLLPQGFFWKNNRFYRIGDHIVLIFSLHLLPFGQHCSIRWASLPFCMKFGEDTLRAEGDEQIEPFLALDPTTDFIHFLNKPMDEQLEIMHRVFFRDIFEHFNAIHNVQDCLSYQNWLKNTYDGGPQNEYLEIPKAWECIHIGNYKDAALYLKRYLKKSETFPAVMPQRLKDAILISEQLLGLIENQNFSELDKLLQERNNVSAKACREYFGEKMR